MKHVTRRNADWEIKREKKGDLLDEIGKAGFTQYGFTKAIWGNMHTLKNRLKGGSVFTHKEMDLMVKTLGLTYWDATEIFSPLSELADKVVESLKKPTPPPPPPRPGTILSRISNGYQATFTGPDGKTHFAYGQTEGDARAAMEKRLKQLTAKEEGAKEEPPKEKGDRLSVTISGDEAMVLLNQLMIDFRNKAVNEKDKPVIQSIFLRLSTQII